METNQSSICSTLGLSIKNIRSRNGVGRLDLSVSSSIKLGDIERIEHGDIRKGDRFIIIRIITSLNVDPREGEKIGRLVKKLYRRRRVKFHLSPCIIARRRGYISKRS